MTRPIDLPSEYRSRASKGGQAPDRTRFVDPWSEAPLIRYLAHLRHQYSGIGLAHPTNGEPIALESLFVQRRIGAEPGGAEIGLSVVDLLEHSQRAVVLGPPGSGRSTLLSWLIQKLTDPDANEVVGRLGPMVPMPIPVETLVLADEGRTIQAIVNQLRRQPFWYDGLDRLLPDLVRRGQVLFLVDGLEDLPEMEQTFGRLRDALLDGMWRFPACSWVITSEPHFYDSAPLREEAIDTDPLPPSLAKLPMTKGFDIPTWHLQPLDSIAVRRFVEKYQELHRSGPTAVRAAAKDLRVSISRSLLALDLSTTPSLLTLLAESHGRLGHLSTDDSEIFTAMVEATAEIIRRIPGADVIPEESWVPWLEAMAREAEIARFASDEQMGRHLPEMYLSSIPAEQLGSILDRDWAAGLLRFMTISKTHKDPGEAATRTLIDEALCAPGLLVGRGITGLSFVRLDVQQILTGRSLGRVLDAGQEGGDEAKLALEQIRSWFRRPDARPILMEVFRFLSQKPQLAERLYKKLIGGHRRRTLGELDDLGPLIHALGRGLAGPLPERVQQATVRFCADATQRWVTERGRVPVWCSDLSPISNLREQKVLDISGCQRIVNLEPLKEMRALQRLDLHDCPGIRDLSGLQRLGELQWLDLRGCSGVMSLGPLAGLPSLQWLDLGGCSSVTSLAPLDGMDQLQALALHGCTKIDDLGPLRSMRRLKALVISDCTGITDLSPLKQLKPGGKVWVRGSGVRELPAGLRWEVVGLSD